jgi:DNA-binding CsgD family transcriptional regulator
MPHRFHGRDQERKEIFRLLDAAETNQGRVVIVEGGEGTGKSALLAEARAEAEGRGFTVATAAAGAADAVLPVAPFLRAVGETPVPRASGVRSSGADDRKAWLIEQLWLMEQLPLFLTAHSELGPVLVTLDDLQWADPATLLALRLLPARLAPSQLSWLVTRRPGEGGHALDQLVDILEGDGATRLPLGPLGDEAVAGILTDALGATPGPGLAALAGEADGIPALVVALAEGLAEEDRVAIRDGRADLVSDRMPRRLLALVGQRLATLSPGTGHLVEVAALLDGPFLVEELARVLERPPTRLLADLEEALAAGVLQTAGECLDFWCGLGRRVVAQNVPEAVRTAVRRQIRAGSTPDAGDGERTGPEPAPRRYPLAGPRRATSAEAAEPVWGAAVASWRDGRVGEALEQARNAVDQAGPAEPGLILVGMLADVGLRDEAERIAAAMADPLSRTGKDRVAANAAASAARARLALDAGHLDEAEAAAEATSALAVEAGDTTLVPAAVHVLATAALRRGDLTRAAQHLEGPRAQPAAGPSPFGSGRLLFLEAQVAHAEGDAARAMELLRPVYDDLAGHRRLLVEEPAAAAWMVRTALDTGAPRRAAAVAAAAAELAAGNRGVAALLAASAHAHGVLDRDGAALMRAAQEHGQVWARGSAAEDAGVVLAEAGERRAALAQFDQALAAYQEAGAATDAARLRSRLRSLGVRRRHWRQASRPVYGWESLTDTERSVADLVAEGLTNRQVAARMFLSPHTVDFHLRQIFRKLDICSRVELTRHVVERDGEHDAETAAAPHT